MAVPAKWRMRTFWTADGQTGDQMKSCDPSRTFQKRSLIKALRLKK
jgi:hypothetical protein